MACPIARQRRKADFSHKSAYLFDSLRHLLDRLLGRPERAPGGRRVEQPKIQRFVVSWERR